MTTGTTALRASAAGHVLRVVKLHVERFLEAGGEVLQRRVVAADVRMANHAHRYCRRGELTAMTISACFVTREARRCGVVRSFVASVTGKGTVSLAGMQKLRVIQLRALCGGRAKKKNCSRKGAKAKRKPQRSFEVPFAFSFAPLRLCGSNHLISLRFSGGRSAIR
jgi:hypothetical protein